MGKGDGMDFYRPAGRAEPRFSEQQNDLIATDERRAAALLYLADQKEGRTEREITESVAKTLYEKITPRGLRYHLQRMIKRKLITRSKGKYAATSVGKELAESARESFEKDIINGVVRLKRMQKGPDGIYRDALAAE